MIFVGVWSIGGSKELEEESEQKKNNNNKNICYMNQQFCNFIWD